VRINLTKDKAQFPYLMGTDYIDKVFPAPAVVDVFQSEVEEWEIRKIHAKRLRKLFADLSAWEYMVHIAYYQEGLTMSKIAELYGCSKSWVNDALKAIKKPPEGG